MMLLTLIVMGELATISVHGTFATYSAKSVNAGSVAAAGTLTLTMQAGSSTCDSWGGSVGSAYLNTNSNCGTLPITSNAQYPGQTTSVDVAITNSGSEKGTLSVYAPAAVPCSPTTPGICDVTEFTLQQTGSDYTTPVACYYPSTGTSCHFATFTSPDSYNCPSLGTEGTLTDFTFCTYYEPGGTPLTLGSPISGHTTEYFVLSFELPHFSSPSVGNTYQGETATFSLTFELDQLPNG